MNFRRIFQELRWGLMWLPAALVALYAVLFLSIPGVGSPDLKAKFAATNVALWLHLAGGAGAIVAGPWQFRAGFRDRHLQWHRVIGKVYAACVAVSGVSGLRLAVAADGGLAAQLGFALLGGAWLATLAMALRAIRSRDLPRHRAWMIRNYSLTFAAVMLRLYLPLAALAGIPFLSAYRVIAWICWLPNLAVAEFLLRRPMEHAAVAANATESGTTPAG